MMNLLVEIHKVMKAMPNLRDRNFVAKHSKMAGGAGVHKDKDGPNAARSRQKQQWKKEAHHE